MKLVARLMTVITIVVAVTDLIAFYHLQQRPDHLTLLWTIGVIFITLLPIGIILSVWHLRGQL